MSTIPIDDMYDSNLEIGSEILLEISPWIDKWIQTIRARAIGDSQTINAISQIWCPASQNSTVDELKLRIFYPESHLDPHGVVKVTFNESVVKGNSIIKDTREPSIFTRQILKSKISLGFLNILSNLSYKIKYQIFLQSEEFLVIREHLHMNISIERHYRDPNLHSECSPNKVNLITSICCQKKDYSLALRAIVEFVEELLEFRCNYERENEGN